MNLKALAAHLGLSQATVSRALNGYSTIANETRDRVVAAAAAHGYRPNQSARALATGRADAIGIVFPAEENPLLDPHFIEFLGGAAEWTASRELSINLTATSGRDEVDRYRRLARVRQVDGFIITWPMLEDPRFEALQSLGIPFVCHARAQASAPHSFLDIDNEGAFRRATKLFIDMGHRRIALINGGVKYTFGHDRHVGYISALGEGGLGSDPRLVFSGPMTEENGFHQTRQMLALSPRPTAFLCGSMIVALGCYRALRDEGLNIPGDVSVIAHDDVFPFITPHSLRPALTTTRSSIREHGRRVAEMLTDVIDGKAEPRGTVLPVELVMRDSVGPAP